MDQHTQFQILSDCMAAITSNVQLDKESMEYYKEQFSKLKNLESISITASDFGGNKTNFVSLNIESLTCILNLMVEKLKFDRKKERGG